MLYRQPVGFGGLQLTAYPAGHCLGSAMLLADDGRKRLLYTGDFKLDASATCEPADLPTADMLIMESTFGQPSYRLPPREEAIGQLVDVVRQAIAAGRTPVLHLYPLGKAQEVTRILTAHGIPVLQHPDIYAISRVYESCGVSLGEYGEYADAPREGHAVITSPQTHRKFRLAGLREVVTIAATGWALDERAPYRFGVDHAIPLSDHADYDQLIETVARVGASEVYCTHGPYEFVELLRDAGYNAHPLDKPRQGRLF
jgi:Cft2 family RNA processing exonuclease